MNLDRARLLLSKLSIKHRDLNISVPYRFNRNQVIAHNMVRAHYEKHRNVRAIILKARRVGMSSYWDSILFCHCLARPQAHAEVVAHLKDVSEKGLFRVPRDLASELNEKVGSETCELYARQIKFRHADGESLLDIATAGSVGGGRGLTLTALHLSEAALYPGQDSFLSILPAVSKADDTIIAIESTAQGRVGIGQTFFEHWQSAKKTGRQWNGYLPIFLSWLDDPACWSDSPALDAPATDLERELMGKDFNATREQIAWMRFVLEGECAASEAKFSQEYPWCLIGSTRVSTNRGIIPIAEVCHEDTHTESGDVCSYSPQPESSVFRLATVAGREIVGTHNHPVKLAGEGFCDLSKLSAGDKIALRPPMFSEDVYQYLWNPLPSYASSIVITESWGRFLGYFMGDGSWGRGGVLSIVCDAKDDDVIEDARGLLSSMVSKPTARTHARVQGCKGAVELRSTCAAFQIPLRVLGCIKQKNCGGWKRDVKVPECMFRSPKSIVREFLRALFECDGSSSSGSVRWGSSNKAFAQDVQLLLLGFGITCKLSRRVKSSGSGKDYVFFEMFLGGDESEAFMKKIGFIGKRKNSLVIPERKANGWNRHKIEMVDEVESVSPAGRAITYDLTVSESHVFSANGILTHNTPEVAFQATGDPAFAPSEIKYAYGTRREEPLCRADFVRNSGRIEMYASRSGKWMIYEKPIAKCHYYIGVDCARGMEAETGRATGDFTAAVVLNGTTGNVAAKFSEWVDPDVIADICDKAGRHYNNAMVNIELTGNLGLWAQKRMREDYVYPNLYVWKGKDDKMAGKSKGHSLGWETTPRTRDLLFSTMRGKLRDGMKNIPGGFAPIDPELVEQMDVATMSTGSRWEVEKGHDDVIVAAMLACIAWAQYPPPNIGQEIYNVYESPKDRMSHAAQALKAQPDLQHALQRDLKFVFKRDRKLVKSVMGGI